MHVTAVSHFIQVFLNKIYSLKKKFMYCIKCLGFLDEQNAGKLQERYFFMVNFRNKNV